MKDYRYQGRHNNAVKEAIQPAKTIATSVVNTFADTKHEIDLSVDLSKKPSQNNQGFNVAPPGFLRKQAAKESCQLLIGELKEKESAVDGLTTNLDQLKNKIPVTQQLQVMLTKLRGPRTKSGRALDFDDSLEVEIGPDTIHESDMKDETPRNLHGDKGLIVIKHGLKTSFTIGLASGIHCVIRHHPSDVAGDVTSSEWCIIEIDGKAFSDKGDSGACVFGLEGLAA
ncbi:hypothetical protein FANTH_932 [Fusarium anthophilum]|uniref:Uncharacterized protein n=1 Tax=Fusarium anthophilum TaxID=48485 RepID=A0A8H5EBL9_9HYPO|nr:hypothetical protein FANTH_932 [Fusarium anthophilum]